MDTKKIGVFFKTLRKEKALTQEALGEILGVSSRTVSRWETGSNMPDLDLLIEMSDFYEVELRELLEGERKEKKMEKELEDTVLMVADYSSEEKRKLKKKIHVFTWVLMISILLYVILEGFGFTSTLLGDRIASSVIGFAFGISIILVIFTSKYADKFRAWKKKYIFKK